MGAAISGISLLVCGAAAGVGVDRGDWWAVGLFSAGVIFNAIVLSRSILKKT